MCNNALPVSPDNPPVAAAASCLEPMVTSSGLYPLHAIYQPTDLGHNESKNDSSQTPSSNATVHGQMDNAVITHLNSGI